LKPAVDGTTGLKLVVVNISFSSASSLNEAIFGTFGTRFTGKSNSLSSWKGATRGTFGIRIGHSGQNRLPGVVGLISSPIVPAKRGRIEAQMRRELSELLSWLYF